MKIIGITMGDPAGVGPEIVVKALADSQEFEADYVVYGAADILQHYIDQLGLNCKVKEISQVPDWRVVGKMRRCGLPVYRAVNPGCAGRKNRSCRNWTFK